MASNKKNNFIKDALALCIITLVAGALLGLVNEITAPIIKDAQEKAAMAAYKEVYTDAADFASDDAVTAYVTSPEYQSALSAAGVEKASVMVAYKALDASGNVIGYVMTTDSTNGYGGQISISVGMKADGTVTGMKYLILNETSGIGSRAAEPDFMNEFIGQTTDKFVLGTNVDAMSGATVTSKAVNNAMNAALVFVQQQAQ